MPEGGSDARPARAHALAPLAAGLAAVLVGMAASVYCRAGPQEFDSSDPGLADGGAVTARRLCDDYEANAVAADRRYKHHILVVTGSLTQVLNSPRADGPGAGRTAVFLTDGYSSVAVRCSFRARHRPRVATLRPGDTVHIRGFCCGQVDGTVHLLNGTFVEDPAAGADVKFLQAEDGPTAVEYAVMLSLIIVVCIAAITALGSNTNNSFSYVGAQIGGSSS